MASFRSLAILAITSAFPITHRALQLKASSFLKCSGPVLRTSHFHTGKEIALSLTIYSPKSRRIGRESTTGNIQSTPYLTPRSQTKSRSFDDEIAPNLPFNRDDTSATKFEDEPAEWGTSGDDQDYDTLLEDFLADILAFKEETLHTYVPKDCFDCEDLGYVSSQVRKAYKRKSLPAPWVHKLQEIDFNFKINNLDAKWHHNFHILRRYKYTTGSLDLPANYTDPNDPKLVECARWLQRQHALYRKQKLQPIRVKMLRNLGLKLRRPYSPKRQNRHPILLDPEKDKVAILRRERLRRRSEQLKRNGTSNNKERRKYVEAQREKRRQESLKRWKEKKNRPQNSTGTGKC